MKFVAKTLLLFAALGTFAYAQPNNIPQVQHVVIVIQENRTPDNLFQEDQTLRTNGAHIATQGSCGDSNGTFALQPQTLATCWDPYHRHQDWSTTWAKGAMTGACQVETPGTCQNLPPCPDPEYTTCLAMSYVQNTAWDSVTPQRILDPYFQIANQYGFANYMFQTNQGPSFPAHQFLFSGTSQVVGYPDNFDTCGTGIDTYDCYMWFAAEGEVNQTTFGCIADEGVQVLDIDPISDELYAYTPVAPNVMSLGFPCYTHQSLPTLLDNANPVVNWRYYGRAPADIWTAPTAINPICKTTGYGPGGRVRARTGRTTLAHTCLTRQTIRTTQRPF